MNSDSPILVVAAEDSSCMYALRFMEQWKRFRGEQKFFGVGNRRMESLGLEILGRSEDLAVVGFQEVLAHGADIYKCFHRVLNEVRDRRPAFALLMDYPGFNLRLAQRLKEQRIPCVYYISPQVWAWKRSRVKVMRKCIEDLLVVFPFEVEFFRSHGIKAHFVGHPLLEVVRDESLDPKTPVSPPRVLGLMPGSRCVEIQHNLSVQLQAARLFQSASIFKNRERLKVKVLVAQGLDISFVKKQAGSGFEDMEFVKNSPTSMIESCDLILAASGTATLQVALCGRPMVVMYRMNPITALVARLLVRGISYMCIVNLVAQKKVVPEYFQTGPHLLAQALERLCQPGVFEKTRQDFKEVESLLGGGQATSNVVQYLLEKYG